MSKVLVQPKLIFLLLFILNAAPVLGMQFGFLHPSDLAYAYWMECALIGAAALFIYAKRLSVFVCTALFVYGILKLSGAVMPVSDTVQLVFWSLYGLCWLIYIEITQSKYGINLRRATPLEKLGFYLIMLGSAIVTSFVLTVLMFNLQPLAHELPIEFYIRFLVVAGIVPTFSIGLLKIIGMIGPGHFVQFLLGTYHTPQEREKIVLFLDIVGSAGMAERLMPQQSMDLIARFIFDATAIFRMHGGDVINYTGDGLVVLWPRKQADRALSSVIALRAMTDSQRAKYRKMFGIVPDFRIGIHSGKLVLQQIGEEKLFLGVYGDVVNTAARLEQMNKDLHTKILLSEALVQDLGPAWQPQLEPMGLQDVRGRTEPVRVFTLGKPKQQAAA